MTGPRFRQFCRDCGEYHQSGGEALDCTERLADACQCGHCLNCKMAAWWRDHSDYINRQVAKANASPSVPEEMP